MDRDPDDAPARPPTPADPALPPPGWYPDPQTGGPRWWDGRVGGAFAPQPPPPPPATGSMSDPLSQASLAHFLGLVIGFLGPLLISSSTNGRDPFVRDQATEALNFQLTVLAGYAIVMVVALATCGIGALLLFPLIPVAIIFPIIGGLAAKRGEPYRYPICIRFVRP